jgi:uncharacterized membrane protein (DUF2068 family)
MAQSKSSGVLFAIALFKLVKAVTLIAIGIAALSLTKHADSVATLKHLVREVGLEPNRRLVVRAISKISGLDHRRLEELSVATFSYAAVFLVEGSGLLLRKRWAEYLTVFVTASFIPFEIYELFHKVTALKAVGIAVNALIVAYLVLRLWRERKAG